MSDGRSSSVWPAGLKRYPALVEYLWERIEVEDRVSVSTDEMSKVLVMIPDRVARILEDDLQSGIFTPHFQRTVKTAWSDVEQRFVLTSDQGC